MKTRVLPSPAVLLVGVAALLLFRSGAAFQDAEPAPRTEATMEIRFLEIVTPDVDATIATLEAAHGVTFSDPVVELGNARTAELSGGNRVSVRAPMHDAETPVVRPYVLVKDIDAAVKAAEAAGAQIAHPPLEIPGQGTFAIYFQGGNQYGLWKD